MYINAQNINSTARRSSGQWIVNCKTALSSPTIGRYCQQDLKWECACSWFISTYLSLSFSSRVKSVEDHRNRIHSKASIFFLHNPKSNETHGRCQSGEEKPQMKATSGGILMLQRLCRDKIKISHFCTQRERMTMTSLFEPPRLQPFKLKMNEKKKFYVRQ